MDEDIVVMCFRNEFHFRTIDAAIRPLYFCVVLCVAFIADAGANQSDRDDRLIRAVRGFLVERMNTHGIPGCNIALSSGDEIIWEEGFGFADIENRIPFTPETVFHSGSMGKTYVATAVMQLVERGYLELDASVQAYISEFTISNPLGERDITVRDLLTHRSGLSINMAGNYTHAPPPLKEHLIEAYGRTHFPPYGGMVMPTWSSKVGEKMTYSNLGIATLGYLVEVTNPEGLSFSDYVQQHIMDPLGMSSSQYPPVQDREHIRPDLYDRMSVGYSVLGKIRLRSPELYFAEYPAGTFVGTPGDHIKLLIAMLNRGTYNGYSLLEEPSAKNMVTPQVTFNQELGLHLGLVWRLFYGEKSARYFGHPGNHMWGWYNDAACYPDDGICVVIATNYWPMDTNTSKNGGMLATSLTSFIADWLQANSNREPASSVEETIAWQASYLAGLIMAERTKGMLGARGDLFGKEALANMLSGGYGGFDTASNGSLWDERGFRAGLQDMLAVDTTPSGIQSFLNSEQCRVPREKHDDLFEVLGLSFTFDLPGAG